MKIYILKDLTHYVTKVGAASCIVVLTWDSLNIVVVIEITLSLVIPL